MLGSKYGAEAKKPASAPAKVAVLRKQREKEKKSSSGALLGGVQMASNTGDAPGRKRVAFSINAPQAESVSVAGDFNNWDPQEKKMKRDETGMWKITMTLPPGEYQYRFVVDGNWTDDPQSERRVPNQFGSLNSVRVVG